MENKHIDPKVTSGANSTYWVETGGSISLEPLRNNIKTDVVIIGAGIAGLNIAYQLTKSGKKVVVLEDGNIGSGESSRTSAHLTAALDDKYEKVEKLFGKDGAKLAAESHMAAIKFYETVSAVESIECEYMRVPGYLFLHPSDKPDYLEEEFKAASDAGMKVRMLNGIPGFPSVKGQCIEFADQAQFHLMKYLVGIADVIRKKGGQIFTQTHAQTIEENEVVTKEGFKVIADYVVVATNTPVNNKYVMHLKQFPVRTYLIAVKIPKDSLPKALWWDTGDHEMDAEIPPYHYLRTVSHDEKHDLLLVGGEDHATGLADAQQIPEAERYVRIENWLKDKVNYSEVVYRWSGQIMEPMDALAYIGRNPADKKNIFIVTGDSGNGLTHGAIAGMLISDLINGVENPWEKLYSPSRINLKALMTWIKEFGGGLIDYLKNNPHHADEVNLSSIKSGEGKIVQLDKAKFGVYRDEEEHLHFVTAECTHLKCIVKWNNDEKSWDCPCHGSRFTYDGKVLNGPANTDLFYWTESEAKTRAGMEEKLH